MSTCLSGYLLWVSFCWVVINQSPQCVNTHASIYSRLMLFNDSKYMYQIWMTLVLITNSEPRPVTMSVSLHTKTGLCHLTFQVLNIRVSFLKILYTSFTSVHSNLVHGLAILQRALVHSNLNYTTSLVEVQSRSDAAKPRYPWYCLFVMCTKLNPTGLNWFQPTWTAGVKCAKCLVENSIVIFVLN